MLKKITIGLISFFIFILLIFNVVAFLYQDEIASKIKVQINQNLNAQVNWEDASLSLLTHFPHITLDLKEIQIIGKNEFQKDTLANIKEINVEIPVFSYLLNQKITLESIDVEGANFNLLVNPAGKMNWDIVKKDSASIGPKEESQAIELKINSYQISEGNIYYNDQMRGFSSRLANINHQGKGDFSQDIFTLSTETQIDQLTVQLLGKTYLSKVKTSLSAPIQMDFKQMKFSFNNNILQLNDLPILIDASISMPDSSIAMDVRLHVKKSPFKQFLSLIPSLYSNAFSELNAQGEGSLKAHLKGKMNGKENPGFGLGIQISHGAFQYASKNMGVKNIEVDFNVNNSDGIPDHTNIQLKKFDAVINRSPIHAELLVKNPVTDPYIKSVVSGNINLADMESIFPLENKQLKGNIVANFALNGQISQLKNGQGMTKGDIQLNQIVWSEKEPAFSMQIPQAKLHFNAKNLALESFQAKIGQSDVEAQGTLENYLLYFLKGENLKGSLTVKSNQINVDELMQFMTQEQESSRSGENSKTALKLPKNIEFYIKSTVSTIKYQNFKLTSAKGALKLSPQKMDFEDFSFKLLESSFNTNGFYSNLYDKNPLTNINFEIKELDIPKAFTHFTTFKKLVPFAAAATGKVNLQFSLISNLNQDMSPNLNTIQSIGELELINVSLKGSEVLNKTADLVKFQALKNLELKPTKINYHISNGRLKVKPFLLQTNVGKINVSGSNGLDQSLDYQLALELPSNLISEGAKSGINKELSKLGLGINVDAVAKFIKPSILIKGNFNRPLLSLGINQATNGNEQSNIPTTIKEVAKVEINKQVDKAKQEAKIQAENIQKQARIAAENLKTEAYKAADRLVEEAKNPLAQFAAKKLAEKLKKEADKKVQTILDEADKKAEELLK
jgi:hypothetical protein